MKKGFTLIEIMTVLCFFFILAAAITPVAYDAYRSSLFTQQLHALVSLLQKARQQSIDNVDDVSHGVHLTQSDATLFEGSSYSSSSNKNELIIFTTVSLSGQSEVVFSQLAGSSSVAENLILSDGKRQATVTVEMSGRIDF